MTFAPVVYLRSRAGHILRTLHPAEARRLAPHCAVSRTRGERIREMTLLSDPVASQAWPHAGRQAMPVTPPRLANYMGQRYTRTVPLERPDGRVDHRVIEFRPIHPGDRPLFRLSVTDCLSERGAIGALAGCAERLIGCGYRSNPAE